MAGPGPPTRAKTDEEIDREIERLTSLDILHYQRRLAHSLQKRCDTNLTLPSHKKTKRPKFENSVNQEDDTEKMEINKATTGIPNTEPGTSKQNAGTGALKFEKHTNKMSIDEGKLNPGIEYQFEIIAYAAACLSQNLLQSEEVVDFEIYTNQDVPIFDDIIIKVKYKSQSEPFVYMGQIKRYKKPKINFSKGKDKLDKYLKKIVEIKKKSNLKPFLKSLLENVPDENVEFFYFSNSFLSPREVGRNPLDYPITLDDGTDCYLERDTTSKSIFRLQNSATSYKLTTRDTYQHSTIFNKFHFFLNQPNHKQIASRIVDLSPNIISISAANDVINYIDAYLKDSEKAKLTKHVFETHLLRLCLTPFIVLPTTAVKVNPQLAHIWNKLVMQFNITITSTAMQSYIFGCVWQEIIKLYNSEFNWNDSITNFKNINKEINISHHFVQLTEVKGIRHWLYIPDTINDLLIEMWKSDYLPLVLNSNTNVSILNKFRHLNKRFVILDVKDKIYNKISILDLRVFANAANICDIQLRKEFLKKIFISLQGREPVNVYSIVKEDIDLIKEIKCVHILYFIREWGCLDANGNTFYLENDRAVPILGRCIKKEEKYINRFLRKATLEATIFDSKEKVICFVTGALNDRDWMGGNRNQIIQGSVDYVAYKIEAELEQGNNAIAAIKDDEIEELWAKVSAKAYPLIHVKVENKIMSILKYQNCQSLSYHISYRGLTFSEKTFFEDTSTGITLITGEPGSGKSTLLRSLFNTCDKHNYVLFCDLNDYRQQLWKGDPELVKNPLSFILGKETKQSTFSSEYSMCPSYFDFLQKLLLRTKDLILFLDSFDEVLPVCQKPVLNFIKNLNKRNVRLIIACRLVMANILINSCEVVPTKIEILNTNDIKEYIANQMLSDDEFQKYPREFQETPLYLNFLVALHHDSSLLPDTITRRALYNAIIKRHIEQYYNKKAETYNSDQYKDLRKDILGIHKSLALFEVFGVEVLKATGLVYKDLMMECINTDKVKLGLIIRFNSDGPVFIHRTFAEYLIAEWLTENIGQEYVKHIYEQLFDRNMFYIRLLLDDILCENLELHTAVLAEDLSLVERLCSEDDNHLKKVDQLSRDALHLASAYIFSPSQNQLIILETIVRHMKTRGLDFSKHDLINKLTWTQYIKPTAHFILENLSVTLEMYFVCTESIEEGIDWCIGYRMFNTAIELLRRIENENFSAYYGVLLRAVVSELEFEMLRQLLELNNYNNMKFKTLLNACNHSSLASTVSQCRDLRIDGGFTPLHIACIYGNSDVVKELIKLGIEVDATDNFECAPISYAIIQGFTEIVTCLVKRISCVNQQKVKNDFSSSPYKVSSSTEPTIKVPSKFGYMLIREPYLYISLRMDYIEIAKVLLEHGFDVNERNFEGDTALHHALYTYADFDSIVDENGDKIKLLLKYEPNCNIQNDYGETPLHKIIYKLLFKIVRLYLSRRGYDDITSNLNIHIQNSYEIIKCLLKAGADINTENEYGVTLLQTTIETIKILFMHPLRHRHKISNLSDVLEILLKAGADVNHKSKDGNTALHIAAQIFRSEFVQILLNNNAVVDTENEEGDTALTIAVHFSDLNTRILLNVGADVNHRNKFGNTALHRAAGLDKLDITKTLLNNGADVNIENEKGETALFKATTAGIFAPRRFPKTITKINSEYDFRRCNFNVGSFLLKEGADVNHQNKLGETPLHLAAREGSINVVKILLDHDADKNAVNKKGHTPISVAKHYENEDVVDILSK